MKAFSWFILVVLFALVLLSCRSMSPTSVSSTSDSTHVQDKLRLIPVKVPGEIVLANTKPLPCDPITLLPKPVTVQAKGKSAKVKAEIKPDGHLEISGGCDSLEAVVSVLDKEVFRLRNQSKVITLPPEFKTRKIDYICRTYTAFNVLLLVIAIILWVRKKLPFF